MSEDEILQDLFTRMVGDVRDVIVGPGDDCAGIDIGNGRCLLIAVDHVVGERHYTGSGRDAVPPEAVGRKLLARNLSDIAAMGGRPTCCLVASATCPRRDEQWLQRFFDGILGLAAEWNVAMIGGDLARTPNDDVASLTILGEVPSDRVCRRSGARPGDVLLATGTFGASLPSGHHLSFTPRCREGAWLAQQDGTHAMIDVSDGLALDLVRLCRASEVSGCLDVDAVPRRLPGLSVDEVLSAGEDYELLVAVAREAGEQIRARWPFADVPLTRIGELCVPGGHRLVNARGQPLDAVLGFDHFTDTERP